MLKRLRVYDGSITKTVTLINCGDFPTYYLQSLDCVRMTLANGMMTKCHKDGGTQSSRGSLCCGWGILAICGSVRETTVYSQVRLDG